MIIEPGLKLISTTGTEKALRRRKGLRAFLRFRPRFAALDSQSGCKISRFSISSIKISVQFANISNQMHADEIGIDINVAEKDGAAGFIVVDDLEVRQ